jgi:hypothetical protein
MDSNYQLHRLKDALQSVQGSVELLWDDLSEEGKKRIDCIEKDVKALADELKGPIKGDEK